MTLLASATGMGAPSSSVVSASSRFDRLTEIQDIQKLRKQIALECQEFKRIVEDVPPPKPRATSPPATRGRRCPA